MAARRFGLKHTRGVPGDCVDLYCWGITRTSVDDQIRLMSRLASGESPLAAADRERALGLMTSASRPSPCGHLETTPEETGRAPARSAVSCVSLRKSVRL